MISKYFIILLACLLFASCNKETKINQSNHEPTALLKKLVNELSNADSISVFVNALKNVSLTKEETEEGITLLIPVNGNSGQSDKIGFVGDSIVKITENIIKDHIIKGILDYPQLTVKKNFVTLSGKAISVNRSADTIWVNGIQMGGRQKTINNDYAVHTLKTSLSLSYHSDTMTTTSLDVAVWDATRWSVNRPNGEVVPHAVVDAYASTEDYNNGIIAARAVTNFKGRALLKNLKVGGYFLEANLNGKTNVFSSAIIPALGYKTGYAIAGIFQNEQEISSAPPQANSAPGNFQWMDSNSDGTINSSDYRILPYERVNTIDGIKIKTSLLIGFPHNR